MNKDDKLAALKIAETGADKNAFIQIAKAMLAESDAEIYKRAVAALLRCSQGGVDTEMFATFNTLWNKSQKAEKSLLLKILPRVKAENSARALSMARIAACESGLADETVKTLSHWRDTSALPLMVVIAESAENERSKIIAQIAIVALGAKIGFDDASADYILKNSVRAEERELCASEIAKHPSPAKIDSLKAAKFPDKLIKTAEKNLPKK